jgi:hypothetical protein
LTTREGLQSDDLYQWAVVWALSARAVRKDAKLATAERDRLGGEYGSAAIALLRKLAGQDYFKDPKQAEKLTTDVDLQALRYRNDFEQLLATLKNK